MKKYTIGLFSLALILAVTFISCDEDILNSTTVTEEEKTATAENSGAELKAARVFESINNFGISEEGKKSVSLEGCPSVDWSEDYKTITLDFADCTDGRSGKLIAVFSVIPNSYQIVNLSADITFDNYVDNGTAIDGKMKLTLTEIPAGDKGPSFNFKVLEDVSFVEGSETFMWKVGTDRNIKWLAGFSTLSDNSDDKYSLDGTSTGVDSNGNEFTVDISTALVFDMSCDYVPEGVMTITITDGSETSSLTIDFGVGEGTELNQCDSWVSISNGTITIKFDTNQ